MTITDKHFRDWFNDSFDCSHGGENLIIDSIKELFSLLIKRKFKYSDGDYALGYDCTYLFMDFNGKTIYSNPVVGAFLLSAMFKADILYYETSRSAVLNKRGKLLKDFMDKKTTDELYEILDKPNEGDNCGPLRCNCGVNGYEEGKKCSNPLWAYDVNNYLS